jgi:hypothetical protein
VVLFYHNEHLWPRAEGKRIAAEAAHRYGDSRRHSPMIESVERMALVQHTSPALLDVYASAVAYSQSVILVTRESQLHSHLAWQVLK